MEDLKSMKIALETTKFCPDITKDHGISPDKSCNNPAQLFQTVFLLPRAHSALTQLIALEEGAVTLITFRFSGLAKGFYSLC